MSRVLRRPTTQVTLWPSVKELFGSIFLLAFSMVMIPTVSKSLLGNRMLFGRDASIRRHSMHRAF